MCVHTYGDQDNLYELLLSYHVDPWDSIRPPGFRSKHFYPLGHLTGPRYNIFIRQNQPTKMRIKLQVARSQKAKKIKIEKVDYFLE